MKLSITEIGEVYSGLAKYEGSNQYIQYLKKKNKLTDFELEYVKLNISKEPRTYGNVVRLSRWYAQKNQTENNLFFLPNLLYVRTIIGETNSMYHLYGKYTKDAPLCDIWIPKSVVLTNMDATDYHLEDIDFSLYNSEKRTLKPHQEDAVKFLVNRKKCILADDMGLGKMEPVSSLIPTPDGFVRMGDIKKGDSVFGRDGKPCKVMEVFPHKDKDIYRVTFNDGSFCYCGEDHLWIVRDKTKKNSEHGWKTMSLRDIMQIGLKIKGSPTNNRFEIPVCEPVEYSEKDYLISPYVLGMCIGDGNICNGRVQIAIGKGDEESAERVSGELNEGYELHINDRHGCPRYYIVGENHHNNEYHREIKRLGLNVHGDNKFIPDEYKFGSITQRTELLKGLMDSDGSITKDGNRISFSTNSERLALDVMELVNSLGGIGRLSTYNRVNTSYKKKERVEYKVHIQMNEPPFHLKRKIKRFSNNHKVIYNTRFIERVDYDRTEDAQCIMVDSEDHSYLTSKNYIVTHNTTTATVASMAGGFEHVLIVCPASVKSTWQRELEYYVGKDEITIVNGSKWDDRKYTIINYDILDNFYEVPTETYSKQEKVYDDNGDVSYKTVKKERVSKKKDVIAKAMENSQLFTSKFDLMIMDEVHKLSNNTSGRYKIISDLIGRSNPKGIYAITGTPLTNTPMNLYNVLKLIGADITRDWEGYVRNYCDGKQMLNKNERNGLTKQFLRRVGKAEWKDLSNSEKDELREFLDKNCKKFWITSGASNLDDLSEAIKHLYIRRLKSDFNQIVGKRIEVNRYTLPTELKSSYDNVWEEYRRLRVENGKENVDDFQSIIEGTIMRQWLATQMVSYTDEIVRRHLGNGEKVMIVCCYDEELYKFKEMYGDMCVVYNGKMTAKQKDKVEKAFMEDDNVRIFIGNIVACGVGLTLVSGNICVFNNFSWVPAENMQAMDRVHRLNQTKDVTVYYQMFKDTMFETMFDKVMGKEAVINSVIHTESQK